MLGLKRTNLRWPRGGRVGEGMVSEFGIDEYPLLSLKWITNKELIIAQGTPLISQAAWMGGILGGNGCVYMYG